MNQSDHADYLPRMTTSLKMLLATTLLLSGVGGALYQFQPGNAQHKKGSTDQSQPDGSRVIVTPSQDVQKVIDRLKSGTTLVFAKGEYRQHREAGVQLGPPYRFEQKRGLIISGEKGARIVGAEAAPLVVVDSQQLIFRELNISFENPERTFPAMRVVGSSEITIDRCRINSTNGEGLVAQSSPSLTINGCAIRSSRWGIQATSCRKLRVVGSEVTHCENQGALTLTDCSGAELMRLKTHTSRIALWLKGNTQASLSEVDLGGAGECGVLVDTGASLKIGNNSRISGLERAIEVAGGGSINAEALILDGNEFLGIQIRRGARSVRIGKLLLKNQKRPLRVEGKTLAKGWTVDASVPIEYR